MDLRGGCCIARYVPGASHVSTVDKIMLRFRPIAPKPAAGATASDGSSSETSDAFLRNGNTKRKYVRDSNYTSKRRICRRKNSNSSPEQKQKQTTPAVTLPLLPETPDRKDFPAKDLTPSPVRNNNNNNSSNKSKKLNIINKNVPVWVSFENRSLTMMGGWCSCVTVEGVTDTCLESEWLGSTDEERRLNLSNDTCPGFISDGYGRVTWTNEAYGKMMMMKGEGDEGQGPVLLVNKVNTVVPHASFTCLVRVVQYSCGKERNSLTVPCDVWRMDCGGFAWRLDVKTALSLRLGY